MRHQSFPKFFQKYLVGFLPSGLDCVPSSQEVITVDRGDSIDPYVNLTRGG